MNLLYLRPSEEMNQLSIQIMEWNSSEPPADVYKTTNYHTLKVKLSLYRPGQTLGLQKVQAPGISRQSVHEVGKAASSTHRLHYPQEISVRGWVDPTATVQLERLHQWKIPMTTPGIEPAGFWLVAQCLNQPHHPTPHQNHTLGDHNLQWLITLC